VKTNSEKVEYHNELGSSARTANEGQHKTHQSVQKVDQIVEDFSQLLSTNYTTNHQYIQLMTKT